MMWLRLCAGGLRCVLHGHIDGNRWLDQSSKPLAALPDDPDFRASSSARAGGPRPPPCWLRALRAEPAQCNLPRTRGLACTRAIHRNTHHLRRLPDARSGARCHSAMRLRETALTQIPTVNRRQSLPALRRLWTGTWPRSDRQRRPGWQPDQCAGPSQHPCHMGHPALRAPARLERRGARAVLFLESDVAKPGCKLPVRAPRTLIGSPLSHFNVQSRAGCRARRTVIAT